MFFYARVTSPPEQSFRHCFYLNVWIHTSIVLGPQHGDYWSIFFLLSLRITRLNVEVDGGSIITL